jgi:hypothetical protein
MRPTDFPVAPFVCATGLLVTIVADAFASHLVEGGRHGESSAKVSGVCCSAPPFLPCNTRMHVLMSQTCQYTHHRWHMIIVVRRHGSVVKACWAAGAVGLRGFGHWHCAHTSGPRGTATSTKPSYWVLVIANPKNRRHQAMSLLRLRLFSRARVVQPPREIDASSVKQQQREPYHDDAFRQFPTCPPTPIRVCLPPQIRS